MRRPEPIERARVALEGLSVGDAFGESLLRRGPAAAPHLVERRAPPGPWRWTDDTQMALSVVEVLARHRRIDQDALAGAFAARYQPHRGYGAAAHQLLQAMGQGAPWQPAARSLFGGQGSMGNGAAMRVAPLGAFFADDLDHAAAEAARSAEVTHAHPEGIAAAVAVALSAALAWLSRGQMLDPDSFLAQVAERVPAGPTRDGIEAAMRVPATTAPLDAGRVLGNGSRIAGPDTVPYCLWVAAHHADDFAAALWATASALGDIDTTCAIVGGIVAARLGADAIPSAWTAAREALPALELDRN